MDAMMVLITGPREKAVVAYSKLLSLYLVGRNEERVENAESRKPVPHSRLEPGISPLPIARS